MLERQTINFAKAALILQTIKLDTNRLDLVLELQRLLIRKIALTERRIKRVGHVEANFKRALRQNRLPKENAKLVKSRIKRCADLIDTLRYLMFVWRCFGDGIAGVYQSKYALKHLYYGANYNIKESSGFISGKTGFRHEWKLLRMGIRMGVPVVLADLTNIIRHGDICALAGEDPLPVEVKSSKNRNARSARQIGQLQELMNFYENDGAESFRGMHAVRRKALCVEEVNHENIANVCVAEALVRGIATVEPEPGLRYIAIADWDSDDHLSAFLSPEIQPYLLAPVRDWLPAYPFTLSLTPSNLVRFLQGHVQIYVLINLAVLKNLFSKHGVHATMIMDSSSAIQVCLNPQDLYQGVYRVSQHRFGRIAGEFQSLAWFAEEIARSILEIRPEAMGLEELEEMIKSQPNLIGEIPPDWHDARDCFDS
jgi:Holliday junction resolvase